MYVCKHIYVYIQHQINAVIAFQHFNIDFKICIIIHTTSYYTYWKFRAPSTSNAGKEIMGMAQNWLFYVFFFLTLGTYVSKLLQPQMDLLVEG